MFLIKLINATKLITKIELVSIQLLYFIILIVAIGAAANLLLMYVIIVNNAKILIYVKVVLITVRVQIMAKAAWATRRLIMSNGIMNIKNIISQK